MLGDLLSSVEAAPIQLSELVIPDAFFNEVDKRFDNFSINPPLDILFPISIEGNTINLQHGFAFSSSTGTFANGEKLDIQLDFKVTVLDSSLNLHGATSALSFTGTGGSDSLIVQSSFFADAGHTQSLGNLSTAWSSSLTDSLLLGQDVHQLFAQLNLAVVGPISDGSLTIQTTFTQAPVAVSVPEPASLILLGSGLVGLAAWRRKHTA